MNAKKTIRAVCKIAAGILAALLLLVGGFAYVTSYKITDIDSSVSDDGQYELLFQSVGEPDWPFGSSHARLALRHGSRSVTKYKLDVENDGKVLYADNWRVSWEDNCVKVTISAEEQADILYILFFDGTVSIAAHEAAAS